MSTDIAVLNRSGCSILRSSTASSGEALHHGDQSVRRGVSVNDLVELLSG